MSEENEVDMNVPLEKKKIIREGLILIENNNNSKPIKEKKPRTENQINQFKRLQEVRKEKLNNRKLEKKIEASKLLLQQDPEFLKKFSQELNQVPTPTSESNDKITEVDENNNTNSNNNSTSSNNKGKVSKKEPTVIELDTDEESEESVIIVKKKAKPKKKKKIIVEQSEESSSGTDEETVKVMKPQRNFVSQQNRKSVIKIHEKAKPSFEHYFV
jgi:hypothetical protein